MNFVITENNAVEIYNENEKKPFVIQPNWPDGTAWASEEEATRWAEAFVNHRTNPDYKFMPGPGPDEPLLPKPVIDPETGLPVEPEA